MEVRQFALCWSCLVLLYGQKHSYGSEIIDTEHDFKTDIKLPCKSSNDIRWFFQPLVDEKMYDTDIPQSSIETINSYETYQHESILTIHNASAFNVGRYGCVSSPLSKEFYVFVKDGKNDLVPVKNRNIVRLRNESVSIPCIPASPEVSIEIYGKSPEIGAWEPVTSYYQDEHTGFTLFNARSEQYMCRSIGKSNSVLYFNVTNERSRLELNVEARKPTDLYHTIRKHGGAIISVGGKIILNCIISYHISSEISNMSWILPHNQPENDDFRTFVTVLRDFPTRFEEEYLTRAIRLTITNATFENSGKYTCDVNVTQGYEVIRTNRRTAVTIVHENASYVDLTVVEALTSSSVSLNSEARIAVDCSVYPATQLYWTKDGSQEPLKGDKYKLTKNHETITLIIREVSLDDAGNYTLRVVNRTESITKLVEITGSVGKYDDIFRKSPMEQFTSRSEFPRTHTTLIAAKPTVSMIVGCQKCICQSNGYPAAEMTFKFEPCPDEDFGNCTDNVAIVTPSIHSFKEGPLTTSTYVIPSNMSGYGICEAANSEGISSVKVKLHTSDLETELAPARKQPEPDIIVDDRVIFLCASVVTSNIKFRLKDTEINCNLVDVFNSGQSIFKKQLMLDNIKVDGQENNATKQNTSDGLYLTRSSFQKHRNLTKITENREGPITCEAKNDGSSTEFHGLNLTLSFQKASPPIILKSVHESQPTELHVGSKLEIKCNATGNPRPSIEWFKGSSPLISNNSSTIQLRDDGAVLSFEELNFNDKGYYTCKASNRFGRDEKNWELIVHPTPSKHVHAYINDAWIYSGLAVLVLLVIIIVWILVLYCLKIKEISILYSVGLSKVSVENEYIPNPEVFLNDQANLLHYHEEYEFPRGRLTFGRQIGAGHFGVVMKATAQRIMSHEDETVVAVKMAKTRGNVDEMKALASELKMMIHIGQHLNVVNLLGAVTKNLSKQSLIIIVEYCCYGNVADHLKKHRNDFVNQIDPNSGIISAITDVTKSIDSSSDVRKSYEQMQISEDCTTDRQQCSIISVTTTDLLCWASQVACGMDYLVSKNVLHGDLAARNILLCKENVVKICDFGLSQSMRSDYKCKTQSGQVLPFKWLALECFEYNTFGTPSDVWAYGVMLWEFFSLANKPYPGVPQKDLFEKLRDGYRLERPEYANREIYNLMLRCWDANLNQRPTFNDLSVRFSSMLPTELQEFYISQNEPYMAMNVMRTNKLHVYDSVHDAVPEKQAPLPPL